MDKLRKSVGWSILIASLAALFLATGSFYYQIGPAVFTENLVRISAAPVLERIYSGDVEYVQEQVAGYYHGQGGAPENHSPWQSWDRATDGHPEWRIWGEDGRGLREDPPFVFQSPDSVYLRDLLSKYPLERISGKGTEYERMLRLFAWVGTRWDHGADAVPGGTQTFLPAEVVAAGAAGKGFWCETAARLAVHAATAMGWPARLVTASHDGYNWDHALASVWSNQFGKWFLVDPDYNLIYEAGGRPLSAFELCHQGPVFQQAGSLEVRRFAPLKPSLSEVDLLPLYSYVSIDLRNDWITRPLRAGSPAGGDLATWWTARDDLGPVLTAKPRVDDPERFNWEVNWTDIYVLALKEKSRGAAQVTFGLRGYAPYFSHFGFRVDGGAWQENIDGFFELLLGPGRHVVEARIIDTQGNLGPTSRLYLERQPYSDVRSAGER